MTPDGSYLAERFGVSSAGDAHPEFFERDLDVFPADGWSVVADTDPARATKDRVLAGRPAVRSYTSRATATSTSGIRCDRACWSRTEAAGRLAT